MKVVLQWGLEFWGMMEMDGCPTYSNFLGRTWRWKTWKNKQKPSGKKTGVGKMWKKNMGKAICGDDHSRDDLCRCLEL